MVVEILEEKLDREYCDNAAKLMLEAVGNDFLGMLSDEECSSETVESTSLTAAKPDRGILDLPKTWETMAADEVLIHVLFVSVGIC